MFEHVSRQMSGRQGLLVFCCSALVYQRPAVKNVSNTYKGPKKVTRVSCFHQQSCMFEHVSRQISGRQMLIVNMLQEVEACNSFTDLLLLPSETLVHSSAAGR